MNLTARIASAVLIGALTALAAVAAQRLSPPDAMATDLRVLLPDGAPHLTANVRVGDLLGDGSAQIFVAEAVSGQVVWVRGQGDPVVFSDGLTQPVRTHAVDIDGDGDKDLLVADIGSILPTDDTVGRVVLLRNNGSFEFEPIVLLENVGRVACAEAADLDGDGDLDIAVCVFGDVTGKVLWLEQQGGFTFEEHVLDPRPGAINAFPFDADADGDLDLAVSLSQESEEVLLFRNGGGGAYAEEVLFKANARDYGISGIELADLDQDGDVDVLLTNGDEGDGIVPIDPNEFHGLTWLENDGVGQFTVHEVVRHWGAYSVRAADIDGDGDMDLVLAGYQVETWHLDADLQTMVWLENDGEEGFTAHRVHRVPPLVLTIDVMDGDSDGVPEVLAGSFNHCSMFDPGCGSVGHRLVTFTITPGAGPRAQPPSAGDPAVAGLARTAAVAGLLALATGLALTARLNRTRGRRGPPLPCSAPRRPS